MGAAAKGVHGILLYTVLNDECIVGSVVRDIARVLVLLGLNGCDEFDGGDEVGDTEYGKMGERI